MRRRSLSFLLLLFSLLLSRGLEAAPTKFSLRSCLKALSLTAALCAGCGTPAPPPRTLEPDTSYLSRARQDPHRSHLVADWDKVSIDGINPEVLAQIDVLSVRPYQELVDARFKQKLSQWTLEHPLYREAESILFLGDGNDPETWISLAEPIAEKYPGKWIYKTDYAITERTVHHNLISMHLDHGKPFPRELKGKFDLVVMRNGLCECDGAERPDKSKTCGGVDLDPKKAADFLIEVGDTLNPNNPKAGGYLLIGYTSRSQGWLGWKKRAALAMSKDRQLQVDILSQFDVYDFVGLRITRRSR